MSNQSVPNEAYFDRNQAAMAFARLAQKMGWTVGLGRDPQEPDWPVLFVDTPHGQLSWHLPAGEIVSDEWPQYPGAWDGHTVQEKRSRLAELIMLQKPSEDYENFLPLMMAETVSRLEAVARRNNDQAALEIIAGMRNAILHGDRDALRELSAKLFNHSQSKEKQ